MSRRTERVSSMLKREVQRVISDGLHDPRAEAIITVLRVEVSDDLREAGVHVSILPEERTSKVMHALRDASAYIRREASKDLRVRRMPTLIFKLDVSLKKERAVLETLRDVEHAGATSPPTDPIDPPPTDEEQAG